MIFMLLIALTDDGRWMQFSQVQLHLYVEMLKAMGLDSVLTDQEWQQAAFAAGRAQDDGFWDRLYRGGPVRRRLAEWHEIFEEDHDVWAETMRHGSELLDHPQMQHLGAVVELDDAERGTVRQPGPIVKISATPAVIERVAPPGSMPTGRRSGQRPGIAHRRTRSGTAHDGPRGSALAT